MALQVIRNITADVIKRGSTRVIYAKQNDSNSRFLNVQIQEDGKNLIIDPMAAVLLNVERPDKKEEIFTGTVNADGTVKVPLTSWLLELAGTVLCDISIVTEGSSKLTTMQFPIEVEAATVNDETLEDTEEYSLIIELLNRVNSVVGQATPEGGEIFNDYHLNKANAPYSHADGHETSALGENSHASGYRTIARYKNQFVCGQLNDNKEDTLFEVGNGDYVEGPSVQSNAFEVYKDGHAEAITTGESDRSLTTKGYVDNTFITRETLDRRFYEYDLDVQETYATKKEVAEKGSLPPVTSTDNGKLLQVVNGAWAAVEIPFAEGVAV